MITSDHAIARFHRHLTLAMAVNIAFAAAALFCLLFRGGLGNEIGGTAALLVIGGMWLVLSYRSIRGSRLAAGSPSLIAAGRLDAAEDQIEKALSSFSLFRTAKLLSLHHLAILRHAQHRWDDSARLSRALLAQRLGGLRHLARQSRLVLAEALLQLGDLGGTQQILRELYRQRLPLPEAMSLLGVQLDYEARINAWEAMLAGVAAKIQLAEIMATAPAAQVQALLALAAKKTGRSGLCQWLGRRVELLVDVRELTAARPALWDLWPRETPPAAAALSAD
jgi:hypothetical protein